jgi:hypothetical protein
VQISKDESGFHKLNGNQSKHHTQLPSVKNAVFPPNNECADYAYNEGKVQLWKDSEKPEDLLEDFQVNIKSLALSPAWQ